MPGSEIQSLADRGQGEELDVATHHTDTAKTTPSIIYAMTRGNPK